MQMLRIGINGYSKGSLGAGSRLIDIGAIESA